MTNNNRAVDEQKVINQPSDENVAVDQKEADVAAEIKKYASQPSMTVKIYSPYKDYFDGRALSISATNLSGPFDILPHHHNFICLLTGGQVTVRSINGTQLTTSKIIISGGLMHVKADRVVLFLDV